MMVKMAFRVAENPDDIQGIAVVRAIVFMHEQHCSYAEEFDGLDELSTQILGDIDGEPLACGRIRYIGKLAKLERLAVRQPARGQGCGSDLLKFMMATAQAAGFYRFTLNSQSHAVGFYQRHGFEPHGELFQEAGIAHRAMRYDQEPLKA